MAKLNWVREEVRRRIRKSGSAHFAIDAPPLAVDRIPVRKSSRPSAVRTSKGKTKAFDVKAAVERIEDRFEEWITRSTPAQVAAFFDKLSPQQLRFYDLFLERIIERQNSLLKRVEKLWKRKGK